MDEYGVVGEERRDGSAPAGQGDALVMDSRVIHGGGANRGGPRRALMYCSLHAPLRLPLGHSCSMLEEYRADGVTIQLRGGGGDGGSGTGGGAVGDGGAASVGVEPGGGGVNGWGEIASTCHPPCYDDE